MNVGDAVSALDLTSWAAESAAPVHAPMSRAFAASNGALGAFVAVSLTGRCASGCDAGYVYVDGRMVGTCPTCSGERATVRRLTVAGLPLDYLRWVEQKRPNVAARVDALLSEGKGPLLWGDTGVGKTWSALTFAVDCIERRGMSTAWVSWPSATRALKTAMDEKTPTSRLVERWSSVPLLVLDDIGTGKSSEWSEEVLYGIVDERAAMGRPTCATSNLSPARLESHIGARVWSRLRRVCAVVEVAGVDRR